MEQVIQLLKSGKSEQEVRQMVIQSGASEEQADQVLAAAKEQLQGGGGEGGEQGSEGMSADEAIQLLSQSGVDPATIFKIIQIVMQVSPDQQGALAQGLQQAAQQGGGQPQEGQREPGQAPAI